MPIRINISLKDQVRFPGGMSKEVDYGMRSIEVPDEYQFLNRTSLTKKQFESLQNTPMARRGLGIVGLKSMADLANDSDALGASLDYETFLKKKGYKQGEYRNQAFGEYTKRLGQKGSELPRLPNVSSEANLANQGMRGQGFGEAKGALESLLMAPRVLKAFGEAFNGAVWLANRLGGPVAGGLTKYGGSGALLANWGAEATEGGGPAAVPSWLMGSKRFTGEQGASELVNEVIMGANLAGDALKAANSAARAFGGRIGNAGKTPEPLPPSNDSFSLRKHGIDPRAMKKDLAHPSVGIEYEGKGFDDAIESMGFGENTRSTQLEIKKKLNELKSGTLNAEQAAKTRKEITDLLNEQLRVRRESPGARTKGFEGGKFTQPEYSEVNEIPPPKTKEEIKDPLNQKPEEGSGGGGGGQVPEKGKTDIPEEEGGVATMQEQEVKPETELTKDQKLDGTKVEDPSPGSKDPTKKFDDTKVEELIREVEKKAEERIKRAEEKAKTEAQMDEQTKLAPQLKPDPRVDAKANTKTKLDEVPPNPIPKPRLKPDKPPQAKDPIVGVTEPKPNAPFSLDLPKWEAPLFQNPRGGSLPVAPAFYKSAINVPAFILGSGRLEYADN